MTSQSTDRYSFGLLVAVAVAAMAAGTPSTADAYIGPGAGFAVLGSFAVIFVTMLLAGVSLLIWPFRMLWRMIRRRTKSKPFIKRLIVVGFDGQEPRITERLMAEGKLPNMAKLAEQGGFNAPGRIGSVSPYEHRVAYLRHLLSYIDTSVLRPLKIVVNAGNGCAGPVLDLLEKQLPLEICKICHEPDGTFPNGIPNPLLPENRGVTRDAVLANGAGLGLAWDGDFDRCFFFDEQGEFVEGYYIVGLLANAFLAKEPDARIIHDPRLTWNTIDIVEKAGGQAVMSKTGHAFIKERMRAEDAVYGGEMSAHHYFRDFAYCDSGMIPWLLVVEKMCRERKLLSELVYERMARFPASGEINRVLTDPQAAIAAVEEKYTVDSLHIDRTDGLSIEFADWRFNLRMSNTEPVVRLNVESRGNQALMEAKTQELLNFLQDIQ